MSTYPDTSFLYAIYRKQVNSPSAAAFFQISQYTLAGGHRALDILHVATALHLGADEFLTFDENQRALAIAEGLQVPL